MKAYSTWIEDSETTKWVLVGWYSDIDVFMSMDEWEIRVIYDYDKFGNPIEADLVKKKDFDGWYSE